MALSPSSTQLAGEREAGCLCPHCQRAIEPLEEIRLCAACGTPHHQDCWTKDPSCGTYACAPARRVDAKGPVLSITADDLLRATPRNRTLEALDRAPQTIRRPQRPMSGLALFALVLAVIGLPIFGLLLGPVAAILGIVAIVRIRTLNQRGIGLASSAIFVGLVDAVLWIFLLWYGLNALFSGRDIADFKPDPQLIEKLPLPLRRAMAANVVVQAGEKGLLRGSTFGSGVVLKKEKGKALIVTNRHVIDAAFEGPTERSLEDFAQTTISVDYIDGASGTAKVLWLAPNQIDLALIEAACDSSSADVAPIRANHPGQVGDPVFAIGNPLKLGWTHTAGSISQFRTDDRHGIRVPVIQTQTAINPGNSGGGLYDAEGYLLGINTWAGRGSVAQGLNFSIRVAALLDLAPPGMIPVQPAEATP